MHSELDLHLIAINRVYRRIPLGKVIQWISEGRVLADDLVSIPNQEHWRRVYLVPELAPHLPITDTTVSHQLPNPQQTASHNQTLSSALSGHHLNEAELEEHELDTHAQWSFGSSKKKPEQASLDLLPMIDVIFQLLIFFMFTNQMANPNPMSVPEAAFGRGVTPDLKQSILIDEQGGLYLGEKATLENQTVSLPSLVQEVADNATLTDVPLDVIIHAHRSVKHGEIRNLVEQLERVDNIGIILLGVEEQQSSE